MESFLTLSDEVARRLKEFRDVPSSASQKALLQAQAKVNPLFDLSQIPPAAHYEVAVATFVYLWDLSLANSQFSSENEDLDGLAVDRSVPYPARP